MDEKIHALFEAASSFARKNAKPQWPGYVMGNVYFELSVMSLHEDAGFMLDAIRNRGTHGKGRASKVLASILALADTYAVPVYLTPKPFGRGGLDQNQLEAWYTRHGFAFVQNRKRFDDMTGTDYEEPLWKRPARNA